MIVSCMEFFLQWLSDVFFCDSPVLFDWTIRCAKYLYLQTVRCVDYSLTFFLALEDCPALVIFYWSDHPVHHFSFDHCAVTQKHLSSAHYFFLSECTAGARVSCLPSCLCFVFSHVAFTLLWGALGWYWDIGGLVPDKKNYWLPSMNLPLVVILVLQKIFYMLDLGPIVGAPADSSYSVHRSKELFFFFKKWTRTLFLSSPRN